MRTLRLLIPALLVVTACSDSATTDTPASTAAPTTTSTSTTVAPTTTATTTTSTSTSTTTTTLPEVPLAEISLQLEEVADGFTQPVFFTSHPVTGDWIVVDQEGTVWLLADDQRWRVLDLRAPVHFESERGLLGFAFHPSDPERVIVHYNESNRDTVIEEYAWPVGEPEIDLSTGREILRHDQPAANHNGGMIAFGPDGYLYIALGDGGAGNDAFGHGQNRFTMLGAILRIDVDGDEPYEIPNANPFADGVDGAPEVFAWGLRNPWRFSFDGEDIWIGDVGQNAIEEIDLITTSDAGINLGWPTFEGTNCHLGSADDCADDSLVGPVFEYAHGGGRCSVTGGYVYRGGEIPQLTGVYLFSDYCTGEIMGLRLGDDGVESHVFPIAVRRLTSFGVDAEGEVYVTAGGSVYRIVDGD